MDDYAKGALNQFWELFIVNPSALKDIKRQQCHYFEAFGSQIKNEVSFKAKEATLRILAFHIQDFP